MDGINENVFEFLRNQKTITATVCQRRFVNDIKEAAAEDPENCQILAENADGSIVAHFPTKWLKIRRPRPVSEERRAELREQLKKAREQKNGADIEALEEMLDEDYEDDEI